jgi:signal recognition particle subunit SRP54
MLEGTDAEGDLQRLFGIIDSMTPAERRNPGKLIDQSRRRRIAVGAGVAPHEVNELVKQFDAMAPVMKQMSSMGVKDRFQMVNELQSGGFLNPGAQLTKQKKGTGRRLSNAEKARLKKEREREARRKKRQGRFGDDGQDNGNPRG